MNKDLYDNKYKVPDKILKYIKKQLSKHPHGDGIKRAKNILKSGDITYQSLKRLKNFYDNYHGENPQQYELSGGDLMKKFVYDKLRNERSKTNIHNKYTKDIKENFEHNNNIKETNVLCVVFNDNHKILLLKRSDYENQWEPNKWCLPGGKIDEGETPLKAMYRELKEETDLDIDKFISSFNIMVDDVFEHVFITKYYGDEEDVNLNFEHSGYGWFFPVEMEFLNTVPNLMEYIKIAITKD
ncbi:MAG: NUDIX hydrolase [bacterium]